ncbi:MAG: hypothetical protein J6W02_00500, partial [Bacteroidaceae bacterium]|nr:hypothetical protein [Bacteroidaceae bacterium]
GFLAFLTAKGERLVHEPTVEHTNSFDCHMLCCLFRLISDAKIKNNFEIKNLSKRKWGEILQLITLPQLKPANVCRRKSAGRLSVNSKF